MTTREHFTRIFDEKALGKPEASVRDFQTNFPKLPKDAHPSDLFEYLNRVCRYCSGWKVFTPPPHTYTEHAGLEGSWWESLDVRYTHDREFYAGQLRDCLISKYSGLSNCESIADLVYYDDGYAILREIARRAGHPNLAHMPASLSLPEQDKTTSLAVYLKQWLHFLHLNYCGGRFYSDRYFLENFIGRLHGQRQIKCLMLPLIRDIPVNQNVPEHMQPEHLLAYMCNIAGQNGIPLSPILSPSEMGDTQRTTQKTTVSLPIRETDIVEPWDDEMVLLMAQITAKANMYGSRRCDCCGDSNHLLANCPQFQHLLKTPPAAKRILTRLLGAYPDTSPTSLRPPNRPGTPTIDNRRPPPAPVRVLDDDDTAGGTDDDGSLADPHFP
jgi:hypothetical protein